MSSVLHLLAVGNSHKPKSNGWLLIVAGLFYMLVFASVAALARRRGGLRRAPRTSSMGRVLVAGVIGPVFVALGILQVIGGR